MTQSGRTVRVAAAAALALATLGTSGLAAARAASSSSTAVPPYDHIVVIVEENHGFHDVIGNPAAPNLNALAKQFGVATDYYGITHPSEPNYVALLGGSPYNVKSDDAYYTQNVNQPSLISQLDAKGISWKAYLQSIPHPGYTGICYPANCNGTPDKDPLYVAKHDGIQNFVGSRNAADWSRQVPIEQLNGDLGADALPRFSYVIPDECHDQHGDPPYCIDSGNPGDPQDQRLVAQGDQYLGGLVSSITGARSWSKGNNAIAVVYDEGDDSAGCCNASPGGGQVAAVVVTNHGPRGVQDSTPANHYSLLATIQQSFGLGCLANTCDTAHVTPLSALFAVTGSHAVATQQLQVPNFATPTPTPVEPQSSTTATPSSGGWTVVPSPLLGSNDNSLGAVAATTADNAWAVGNFLPDTSGSNQDATLASTAHWDGTRWSAVQPPNSGPNFNTLFGVAAAGSSAWAVGVALDNSSYQNRALVESWDGSAWHVVSVPQPGTQRDMLFAASASSPADVWAVGDQAGPDNRFATLVEHFDGSTWTAVPSPNPGSTGNHLYGVSAVAPNDVWAVGEQLGDSGPDAALIEHWDGARWSVIPPASNGGATSALFSVSAHGDQVLAAGETEDPQAGAHALVESLSGSGANVVALPAAGSAWTTLWGVTATDEGAWAAGTYLDPGNDNFETLMFQRRGDGWHVVNTPNPGSGSNIFGGVAAAGGTVWAAGVYDNGNGRLTLIERTSTP